MKSWNWAQPHQRLKAFLIGGASLIDDPLPVGVRNIECATQFLSAHRIPIYGSDVGGNWARRVHFCPVTGEIDVRRVDAEPGRRPLLPQAG